MHNKKILLIPIMLGSVILAWCGQRVEMSFDDAHKQFNQQLFANTIEAHSMQSTMEYISWYETYDLEASAQGLELDAEIDLDYKGKKGAMEFVLGILAEWADTNEGVNFNFSLESLLREVNGEIYFYVEEAKIANEEEQSPMLQLAQAFADQLSQVWIYMDYSQSGNAMGANVPGLQTVNPSDLNADWFQNAKEYYADVQILLNDNLLFQQNGGATTLNGKVVYPVVFNVNGIRSVVDGIVNHEYANMFLSTNGVPLSDEEKQSLIDDIPAMFAELSVDALLRVDAKDRVALVINQLGFAAPDGSVAGGIVHSEVSPKKLSLTIESADGEKIFTAVGKLKGIELTFYNPVGKTATVLLNGEVDIKEWSILYNFDINAYADLGKLQPGVYDGEELDLTLTIEKLIEVSEVTEIGVPQDPSSLQSILEAMWFVQPVLSESEYDAAELGSANPLNAPMDEPFVRNEFFMGE